MEKNLLKKEMIKIFIKKVKKDKTNKDEKWSVSPKNKKLFPEESLDKIKIKKLPK